MCVCVVKVAMGRRRLFDLVCTSAIVASEWHTPSVTSFSVFDVV